MPLRSLFIDQRSVLYCDSRWIHSMGLNLYLLIIA